MKVNPRLVRAPSVLTATATYALYTQLVSACAPALVHPRAATANVGSITVTSSALAPGRPIPVDYTCDGRDVSPPIVLSEPPERTASLALIVDDPDAPGGTFTHFVLFNIPPTTRVISEDVSAEALGPTARVGRNSRNDVRYAGPCPPRGEVHNYRFSVFALDTMLTLSDGTALDQVYRAMDQHVIGEGTLTATFGH